MKLYTNITMLLSLFRVLYKSVYQIRQELGTRDNLFSFSYPDDITTVATFLLAAEEQCYFFLMLDDRDRRRLFLIFFFSSFYFPGFYGPRER